MLGEDPIGVKNEFDHVTLMYEDFHPFVHNQSLSCLANDNAKCTNDIG